MSKRIKIDTNSFKVSKPNLPQGTDVTNATADQLAFDSGAALPFSAIIMQGVTDTTSFAVTVGSAYKPSVAGWYWDGRGSTRKIKTINFPTAQSSPPDLLFMLQPLNDTSYATPHYSHVNQYIVTMNWAGTAVWASTSTTALTLRVDIADNSNGIADWRFSYVVFQNFTGLPGLYT